MTRKHRTNNKSKDLAKGKKRPSVRAMGPKNGQNLGSTTVQRERSTPPALSEIDRFEALIRHPQFQNEMRELEGHIPSNDLSAINKVCSLKRRWGLRLGVELCAPDWIEDTRRAITHEGKRVFIDDAIEAGIMLACSGESVIRDEMLCGIEPGQNFIWMRINLQHPLTTLVDQFKGIVVQRKFNCGFQDRRIRGHQVSIWGVWDKHKIEGKTLLRVAQEECGLKENPAYSSEVKRVFEAVRIAYAKAESILEQISPR
ncbi:MAG: hypothetical protein HY348_04690 [Nitrospira defluvii]|nr:hypothetical protein [Nitrospira defluvii]